MPQQQHHLVQHISATEKDIRACRQVFGFIARIARDANHRNRIAPGPQPANER